MPDDLHTDAAPDTALSQRPIGSTVRLTDQELTEAGELIENGDGDLIADEVILALIGEIQELRDDWAKVNGLDVNDWFKIAVAKEQAFDALQTEMAELQAQLAARTSASDRDALVELILPIDWSGGSAGSIADAVIGARWRPPAQVITDPDTPDTFPARTVGVDQDGEVWVSRFTDWVVAFDQGGTGERLSDIVADFGPLTIVYVPAEAADRG